MDYAGSGDPTQEDCVDEATNTTSFMLVLQVHGFCSSTTPCKFPSPRAIC